MKTLFLLSLVFTGALVAETSPYAGDQSRRIKALGESEIDALLAGRGMGLARPAELNGYPGPRHVLDLATELKLTAAQSESLTRVFQEMRAAAVPLGEKVVRLEAELDRLFGDRRATADVVAVLTREIGRLQGELRAVHLNAHVATVRVLNAEQIAAYNHLRGYDATAGSPDGQAGHHPHAP